MIHPMLTVLAAPLLFTANTVDATAPELAVASMQDADTANNLSADALARGQNAAAVDALQSALEENPGDPALLINLGIARARMGDEPEARALFEEALASREVIELETAEFGAMDSRRLARRALAMLDRGEFRPASARAAALSRRN